MMRVALIIQKRARIMTSPAPADAKMKKATATAVRCTDNEVRGTPERNLRPFAEVGKIIDL